MIGCSRDIHDLPVVRLARTGEIEVGEVVGAIGK